MAEKSLENKSPDKPYQYYMRQSVDGDAVVFIYTENVDLVKDKKFKIEPSGSYSRSGKLVGYHFNCIDGDEKMIALFKMLGLTEENEKKPERRKRRTKAQTNEARASGKK